MPTFRHRKRLRPPLVRPCAQANKPVHKTQQLDVWLLRLSHFSQLGLFLFTVGAIYFTVIPLYQKALLDETIAKKEVELTDANAALERAYASVRTAVVKDYVFFAGAKCTGLLERAEPLPSLVKPVPARPSLADTLFAIDVPACLTNAAKESVSLQELRAEDRKLFDQRLLALGEEVLALRQHAMVEHKEVPSRAAANPPTLPPLDGFTSSMLEFLANREPPERHQQRVREAAIKSEQSRIATAYANKVRQKVSALKAIEWGKEELTLRLLTMRSTGPARKSAQAVYLER